MCESEAALPLPPPPPPIATGGTKLSRFQRGLTHILLPFLFLCLHVRSVYPRLIAIDRPTHAMHDMGALGCDVGGAQRETGLGGPPPGSL